MDAYVFVWNTTNEELAGLHQLAGPPPSKIRYVATLAGRYDAVLAMDVDSLEELRQIVLESVRGPGTPNTETILALPGPPGNGPTSPKWSKNFAVTAWVRILVERGTAESVRDSLLDRDFVDGAAVVVGEFDVLATIGGDSVEAVGQSILEGLHGIEGIDRTSSSFALQETGPYYAESEA